MGQGTESLWKFWSPVPCAPSLWAFQGLLSPGGQAGFRRAQELGCALPKGHSVLSSSMLLHSPWQDAELLRKAAEEVAVIKARAWSLSMQMSPLQSPPSCWDGTANSTSPICPIFRSTVISQPLCWCFLDLNPDFQVVGVVSAALSPARGEKRKE